MDPTVQRIVLIDGPSVLGWEHWREIDNEYALGLLRGAMERLQGDGDIAADTSIEYLSHLLLGVISEASHTIASAPDVAAARADVGALVDRILDGLRER